LSVSSPLLENKPDNPSKNSFQSSELPLDTNACVIFKNGSRSFGLLKTF
jgi:hypothetical protein